MRSILSAMTLRMALGCVVAMSMGLAVPAVAQAEASAPQAARSQEARSITRGSVDIEGRTVAYTATAGRIALTNAENEPTAHMFYVAYVADRARGAPERPVTFVYNGGFIERLATHGRPCSCLCAHRQPRPDAPGTL